MNTTKDRLDALTIKNDNDIDLSDIPEVTEDMFAKGYFRNKKEEPFMIHLELDVMEALKAQNKADSAHVNEILRQAVFG